MLEMAADSLIESLPSPHPKLHPDNTLWVDEQIWGHRLWDSQSPWLIFLEFLVVAEACRRRKRRRLACVLLALAGPLGGIAISVARFYGSPMVFGYDPFFGYFAGTLYDTVVDARPELWTYRAGTLATLAAVTLLAASLTRNEEGRLRLSSLRGNGKGDREVKVFAGRA